MSQNIKPLHSGKVTWLADQVFASFPQDVTDLKFYVMNCGCIYYQRVFSNADLDPQVGIYRDPEDGLCDVCMHIGENWNDRVVDETIAYNRKCQIS